VQQHASGEVEIFVVYTVRFSYESIGEKCSTYFQFFFTIHICQSDYQTSSGILFWDTVCLYAVVQKICHSFLFHRGFYERWPISNIWHIVYRVNSQHNYYWFIRLP